MLLAELPDEMASSPEEERTERGILLQRAMALFAPNSNPTPGRPRGARPRRGRPLWMSPRPCA